jgi:tRNA (uracil-5-)-methyltransferase TRM9
VRVDRSIISRTADAYSCLADEFISATSSYLRYPGLDAELREFAVGLPEGAVLDVGCGSGRDSLFLKSLGRQLVASDISSAMLRRLRPTALRGSLVSCEVTHLAFGDNSFAGVIASGVLLHVPRDSCLAALREIERVLIPDGSAAISMKRGQGEGWRSTEEFPLERWFSYYMPSEFAGLCEKAGLSIGNVAITERRDWFVVIAVKGLRAS